MTNRTIDLDDRLHGYLLAHSLREPAVLARLRAETARLPERNMQIAPEQGQFMAWLARALGARRCIEVGTFTGYSSLAVALVLPPDGRVVCCDVSDEFTAVARRYWAEAGVLERMDLRLAPALDTLATLAGEPDAGRYDLAFIDADKVNYANYYARLLPLLRPGGVILVDNVLWDGRVADPAARDADTEAIRAFNDAVHRDERVDLTLVPIGDGLTLLRKR